MQQKSLERGCGVSISGLAILVLAIPVQAAAANPAAAELSPARNLSTPIAPGENRLSPNLPKLEISALPESSPRLEWGKTTRLAQQPTSETIQVNKIQVTGSTIFTADKFRGIIQPLEGRAATRQEIKQVADAITKMYLDGGYITSRAVVEPTFTNGIVQIRVIEGTIEQIEIEGTQQLQPKYIRSRLELATGKPLNAIKLENQLRLLRADPLFSNVEASLRAGSDEGKSILTVRVKEANVWQGSVGIDNYSPPAVGSERITVGVRNLNITGHGDQFAATYYRTTTGGAEVLDLNYQAPINATNGTLQFRTALTRNIVTQAPFNIFDLRGESQLFEATYRQPVFRSPRQELALSFGFAYQNGQTFTFAGPTPFSIGPDANGLSRTSAFKFGQEYTKRDLNGAWSARSLFTFGVGLFGATINTHPIPDSLFTSWLGQVQRLQVLDENNLLIAQGDLQLSNYSLLPSQQFVIGGGQSVRGFRQNVRAGDSGFRFSVENRINIERNAEGISTLQVAPFFDAGLVWNADGNPNLLPSQTFLAGLGVGLIWQPLTNLNARLDYALPLVNLSDRGTNFQDNGLYFSLGYQF